MPQSVRFATSNMFKDLDSRAAHRLVALVTEEADVVFWQECETAGHRLAIKDLGDDWTTWWPGGSANACPISWRHSVMPTVKRQGRSELTVEGEAGVTPDRWMNDIVLGDQSGTAWPCINTHMISQAWTKHPERRKRWNKQASRLRARTATMSFRWGRCVGGTDANRSKWAPAGTIGLWAKHGTYGAAFYDVIWKRGKVALSGTPHRVETPSDHDALVATLVA